MALTLSAFDLRALSRCSQILLDPLAHPSPDAWRSRVNDSLKELLGADAAGFHLPETGGPLFYSDEYTPELLDALPELEPPPLPDGTSMVERALELGAGKLEEAYGRHADRYYRSPFFREYAAQLRKHDLLFAMCPLRGGGGALVSLQLFHESPVGRRFGDREIELLRLLLPAVKAGSETLLQWGRLQGELLDTLDRAGAAALIIDLHGGRVHRTRGLEAMLAADPERERLVAGIAEAAEPLRVAAAQGFCGAEPPQGCERVVATAFARYRVRLCLRAGDVRSAARVVAGVERLTRIPHSETELRQWYSLTRAEVRVSALLADGRSNEEIARELCISPHTARRHTERILLKMGIRSRAEVAARYFA